MTLIRVPFPIQSKITGRSVAEVAPVIAHIAMQTMKSVTAGLQDDRQQLCLTALLDLEHHTENLRPLCAMWDQRRVTTSSWMWPLSMEETGAVQAAAVAVEGTSQVASLAVGSRLGGRDVPVI